MQINPWKVLETTHPRKDLRVDTCEIPGGRIVEKMVLEFGTWANVVALTPEQEVILIRQYRHGVGKTIWEIPGGVVDPGETPMQAAGRELLEETGYRAGTLIETGIVSPNPDNHTNFLHTFLAMDVEKTSGQELDDSEEIDVHLIPLSEVLHMALNGEIIQAMHISTLFFALAHLKRIS
jgi:8-oxo-dGTP pyrophosphatase MutT (NUDIX family)